ncbi:caspase family protein [Streptomyces sp. NPDC059515]|uniref:caspase, EACC1-associated type n=1 Tax=Streptomyces sp. NPDC059515 TaxID=3346854 RepID=UPI0036922A40
MAADRHALLVATGHYEHPDLRLLRSPTRDAEGLAAVLQDPLIGDFEVGTVVDGRHDEVARAIEVFFRDRRRDDLLLLHLSCHGVKNDSGELHFATADTDPRLLASTSVPAAFLHTQMSRCRARSIVLLLDCCYSGAFLPGAKGDTTVHVRDELAGHGRVVITATNRTEYAWEGRHVTAQQPEHSRFTGAVVEGLRTGEADRDGDGLIGVHDLYDHVYEELRAAGVAQRPQMWLEVERQVVVARSVRPPRQRTPEAVAPPEPVVPPDPVLQPDPVLLPGIPAPGPSSRAAVPRAAEGPVNGLARLVAVTETLSGLDSLQDPPGRARFATVLAEQLGRGVDVRGVRLREDVLVIGRAALAEDGHGLPHLLAAVELFEGRSAADALRRLLESADSPAGARERPPAAPATPTRPAGAARVPAPALPLDRLAPLADVMGTWPGMQDAPGRTHFASVLEHQLGRRIDLRGVRLREDVVTLLRAAAGAPDGLRELVRVAAVFEGAETATEFEQLIDDLP